MLVRIAWPTLLAAAVLLVNAPAAAAQSLATQPAATQALFRAAYGDQAAARWVAEHEAATRR